jgi:Zn-dependent protease
VNGLAGNGLVATILLIALPLVFAITLHEAAHGWVAKQLGDKTAYMLGRVSLNPIRHIDPFGTIALPLLMIVLGSPFVFGWAKPVPVNWANLKNLRRDKALVALAGPAANLVMAFGWAFIAFISLHNLQGSVGFSHEAARYFYSAGQFGVMINVVLCVLNLLPIPPLDGSRIVSAIIPRRWTYYYERVEPYGIWILLGLLFLGLLQHILFGPVRWMAYSILSAFGLA